MKKLLLITTLVIAPLFAVFGADVFTTDISKLPDVARAFITKNFAQTNVSGIKIDKGWFSVEDYEVALADGTKLKFKANGNFEEAETISPAGLPSTIIPANISNYINKNYAGIKIKKFEVTRYGYEVELASKLEIKFDKSGNFLGIDM